MKLPVPCSRALSSSASPNLCALTGYGYVSQDRRSWGRSGADAHTASLIKSADGTKQEMVLHQIM